MALKEQSMLRRQQVDDYRASGKTAAAWCSENNINVSTLRYWMTRLKREVKTDFSQELFIELKQPTVREVPVTVKIGAVSIEVYAGFQAQTLREVLTAVRSL